MSNVKYKEQRDARTAAHRLDTKTQRTVRAAHMKGGALCRQDALNKKCMVFQPCREGGRVN